MAGFDVTIVAFRYYFVLENTAADVGITDVDRREGNYHVLLIDGTRWLFNSYGAFINDENAG